MRRTVETLNLSGWQRLWVIVSVLLLLPTALLVAVLWPSEDPGIVKDLVEPDCGFLRDLPQNYLPERFPDLDAPCRSLHAFLFVNRAPLNSPADYRNYLTSAKTKAFCYGILAWTVSIVLVYLAGWSIGWVRRGFVSSKPVIIPESAPPVSRPPSKQMSSSESPGRDTDAVIRVPESPPLTRKSAMMIGLAVLWCFVVTLGNKYAGTIMGPPEEQGRFIGSWMGVLLLVFIIAWLVAGRKSRRNWPRFARWFFWLGILLPILSNAGRLQTAREEERAVTRKIMEKMVARNKRFSAKADHWKSERFEVMYSASSFTKRSAMQQMITDIQSVYALDQTFNSEMQQVLSDARNIVRETSWSEARKSSFWEGFLKGTSEGIRSREQLLALEKEWVEATIDLYRYATENFRHLRVLDDELFIEHETVREQFNQKLETALAFHKKFVEFCESVEKAQKDQLSKYNTLLKDLGSRD